MAGGENTAKDTVMQQVADLIEELKSGEKLTQETIIRCLVLQFHMLGPLFENSFVTTEQCELSHEDLRDDLEDALKGVRLRFNWAKAAGIFGSVGAVCLTVLRLAGKI